MKAGAPIVKIAFAAIFAIPAVVISSVGCGSLLGGLVAYAIVGGGKPGVQAPGSTNVVMAVILAIAVIAALVLAALLLSSVKFSEDDDKDDRIRLMLLGEQLLLSATLTTVMVVSGSANLNISGVMTTAGGSSPAAAPRNATPVPPKDQSSLKPKN